MVKQTRVNHVVLVMIGVLCLLVLASWIPQPATAHPTVSIAMQEGKIGLTSDDQFAMQQIMAGTVELMTVMQNDKDGDISDTLKAFADFVDEYYHEDFVYQIIDDSDSGDSGLPTSLPLNGFVDFFVSISPNIVSAERLLGLPIFVSHELDETTNTEIVIAYNRSWTNLIFAHEPMTKNGNFARLEWIFTRSQSGPWQLLQWDDTPNIFPMTTISSPNQTEDPAIVAELAAQIPKGAESIRGERTCELYELSIEDGNFVLTAWNNNTMHNCPDEWLAEVDPEKYFVAGPRWRSVDLTFAIDENNQLNLDTEAALAEAVIAEVPEGLGRDMMLAAKVTLVSVAQIEQRTGMTIETIDDVPAQMRQALLGGSASDEPYSGAEVARQLNTVMVHRAGQNVYTINDGTCSYAMKFYTNQIDPSLTSEEAIAQLGPKFKELPEGYIYEVRVFDEDIVVVDTDGLQYVIEDEFGNSYDRFECSTDEK